MDPKPSIFDIEPKRPTDDRQVETECHPIADAALDASQINPGKQGDLDVCTNRQGPLLEIKACLKLEHRIEDNQNNKFHYCVCLGRNTHGKNDGAKGKRYLEAPLGPIWSSVDVYNLGGKDVNLLIAIPVVGGTVMMVLNPFTNCRLLAAKSGKTNEYAHTFSD